MLSYTTSPAYHMIEEKKDNYAAASFAEATICRSKLPRVPPPASSRNWRKNSSNLWSLGFQNAIPTGNWMYPVTKVTLPAGFDTP